MLSPATHWKSPFYDEKRTKKPLLAGLRPTAINLAIVESTSDSRRKGWSRLVVEGRMGFMGDFFLVMVSLETSFQCFDTVDWATEERRTAPHVDAFTTDVLNCGAVRSRRATSTRYRIHCG